MSRPSQKPDHRWVVALCVALLAAAGVGVGYAPTFYGLLLGSRTLREAAPDPAIDAIADRAPDASVKVSFDADVGNDLDWEFHPEEKEITAEVGKPLLVHFDAWNRSGRPLVARVVFDMSPFQAAQYFFEVQQFCFTDVKLAPGERARIPLLFYFDKGILSDREAVAMRHVSLVYTVYRQDGDADRLARAPDLKTRSEALDALIASGAATAFVNDAPHD